MDVKVSQPEPLKLKPRTCLNPQILKWHQPTLTLPTPNFKKGEEDNGESNDNKGRLTFSMSARGGLSGKPQSTRQNVRVVCRVRPTNQKEISSGGVTCVKQNGTTNIEVNADGNQNSFSFDRIFGPDSSQIQVFQDSAYPLIADVLAGYNATIFAYGQTGTGKVRHQTASTKIS